MYLLFSFILDNILVLGQIKNIYLSTYSKNRKEALGTVILLQNFFFLF